MLKDVTAKFGDPASHGRQYGFYSFSTWRVRINVKGESERRRRRQLHAPNDEPDVHVQRDPNDFDCRFTDPEDRRTQCVPFFKDPSAG